jgi:hypothetical protein
MLVVAQIEITIAVGLQGCLDQGSRSSAYLLDQFLLTLLPQRCALAWDPKIRSQQ